MHEDPEAFIESTYDQLRDLARRRLVLEQDVDTMQATALVHEVYMKLGTEEGRWEGREHYYNAAAQAMRRLLVDQARHRRAEKHGGSASRVSMEDLDLTGEEEVDLVALDEALERFSILNAEAYRVVELRFLVGLSVEETARITFRSERTVKREWAEARRWLREELVRIARRG